MLFASCQAGTSSQEPKPKQVPGNINRMTVQSTGPVRYVALGDSTGAGVGAKHGGYVARLFKRIQAARPGSTLTNLCVSGATSDDVLRDQLQRGIEAKPTLVTLGIGTNDIGHDVSLESYAGNYETIVSRIASETDAVLVITNLPDTSAAPRLPNFLRPQIQARIVLFNQKIAEIAASHGVVVVDVYSVTHELLPSHPEYFSADGFHPSDAGYEVWAEEMWPTVAAAAGIQ